MAKSLMIQGTMSNAGKSLLTAGLLRVMKQDGLKVCPFKSQNMALNSFITDEGLEMGRAQAMQAQAAMVEPSVLMNPILLKPTTDVGSQVIVNGRVLANMQAKDYFAFKKGLKGDIMDAYSTLSSQYDVIVIEGAGSPAEINLKADDIVNMGLARMAGAPVLIAGDIDRGGVFAQLYGTVMLLEEDERAMVKGLIINKFRGDKSILDPGIDMIEDLTGIPVIGTVPYINVDIDDEDSLSERFARPKGAQPVSIAVIRLPRISNFTDFAALEAAGGADLYYAGSVHELGSPDMIIIPGTKSTISDLLWMRANGLEAAIKKAASAGTVIMGICGGYQMLGRSLYDPCGAEGGGNTAGMGLLPMDTVFAPEKTTHQTVGRFSRDCGLLSELSAAPYSGYEIHMGVSRSYEECAPLVSPDSPDGDAGAICENIYGTYVHGIFDSADAAAGIIKSLYAVKGLDPENVSTFDMPGYRQAQYDKLADAIRESIDMKKIYEIIERGIC